MSVTTAIQEKKLQEALALAKKFDAATDEVTSSEITESRFSTLIRKLFDQALSKGVKEAEEVFALLSIEDCQKYSSNYTDFGIYISKLLTEREDKDLLQKMLIFMQINPLEKIKIFFNKILIPRLFENYLVNDLLTWKKQINKGETTTHEDFSPSGINNILTRIRWMLKLSSQLSKALKNCLPHLFGIPDIMSFFPCPNDSDSKFYHELYQQLLLLNQNHLLVHRFGIDFSYRELFAGFQQVEFEGADEVVMIPEVINSFTYFIKDPKSRETLKYINGKYDIYDIKESMESLMGSILEALPETAFLNDSARLVARCKSTVPLLMPVVLDGDTEDSHVFAFGMIDKIAMIGNRGAGKFSGFEIFEIEKVSEKEKLVHSLLEFNQNRDGKSDEEKFRLLVKNTIGAKNIIRFPRMHQFSGTCAFASCAKPMLQMAMFFKLFIVFEAKLGLASGQSKKPLISSAMGAATILFKVWVSYDLNQFLKEYLKRVKPVAMENNQVRKLLSMIFLKYEHRKHRHEIIAQLQGTGLITEIGLKEARAIYFQNAEKYLFDSYSEKFKIKRARDLKNVRFWAERLVDHYLLQNKEKFKFVKNQLKASTDLKIAMDTNNSFEIERCLNAVQDLNLPVLGCSNSFLEYACEIGNLSLMQKLIEKGAAPAKLIERTKEQFDKESELYYIAAKFGHDHIIKFLLKIIPECIDCKTTKESNDKDYSPLAIVCRKGRLETAKLLVEAGAKVVEDNDADDGEHYVSDTDIIRRILRDLKENQKAMLQVILSCAKIQKERLKIYLGIAKRYQVDAEIIEVLEGFKPFEDSDSVVNLEEPEERSKIAKKFS